MQYLLMIIFIGAGFLGLMNKKNVQSLAYSQTPAVSASLNQADLFLRYRDLALNYVISHPTFLGTIPSTQFDTTVPAAFLATVGNVVTSTSSGNGRVISSYVPFDMVMMNELMAKTENDASFGVSQGGTWKSSAVGVVATPIPVPAGVPSGVAVSIVQIGV